MDASSKELMDDYFLRQPGDVRTTNVQAAPKSVDNNKSRKTELHVVRLTDASQQIILDMMRTIHGPDFKLDDISKYKEMGSGGHGIKHGYWEERGTLQVRSIQGVSAPRTANSSSTDDQQQRLRRYALLMLESYGFHPVHCQEAYDHCLCNIESALMLLYRRYMRIPENESTMVKDVPTDDELLNMRADEKLALESIYGDAYEEREPNVFWNMKFKIDHLLVHSPSELRRARLTEMKAAQMKTKPNKIASKSICRNFERDGHCRFGSKCRFLHVQREQETQGQGNLDENENEMWFNIEVRFPPGNKYPYEAPFFFLKTTCHDIPDEVRLRLARQLYRTGRQLCVDGIPFIYTICEMLQRDEEMAAHLDMDDFPSPKHSLFYDEPGSDIDGNMDALAISLPSHYELGETWRQDNARQGNSAELARRDRRLMQQFEKRQQDDSYRDMIVSRSKLPAWNKMQEIIDLIDTSPVVVISGETGCGKSTQVPQFILDSWFFEALRSKTIESKMPHVEIICTQPRRLSAIGVAERVAAERLDRIGELVGYQIRMENKISSNTRLTFCTTGILLRRLASDPLLSNVTHIIVDEVHERSEDSDFLLLILKNILKERKDLKVILMSATLNASLFSDYFGRAPVLDIPGRTYPVEQHFLEDILEKCDFVMELDSKFCRKIDKDVYKELLSHRDYSNDPLPDAKISDDKLSLSAMTRRYQDYSDKTRKNIFLLESMRINTDLVESVVTYIMEGEHDWPRKGTILIFLPGYQEIQSVHDALNKSNRSSQSNAKYVVVPLHSALSSEDQALVFSPAPAGKRKIVLSTNIAETSVTIDDCVFVIDCGLMKEKRFDSNRNMESLDLVWASRANAKQRMGRAGRVMPGVCIHLYTSNRFRYQMAAQPVPEIQRVPLEQIVLRIKTLKAFETRCTQSVLSEVLEAPSTESVAGALMRLRDVGALDANDQLTPLGHHLSALPVDVRIGKLMLFGAIFQCLDSVLTIAACLSHKSPFLSSMNKQNEAKKAKLKFAIGNSDHLTMLNAYRQYMDVAKRNSFVACRNFTMDNYLSLYNLNMICDLKYQYLELLVSIGFVPMNLPRRRKKSNDNILELTGTDLNMHGDNHRLLTSLLCAALYPNVVKIMTPETVYTQTMGGSMPVAPSHENLRFKTCGDGYVRIHSCSVNSQVATFMTPFLVYQEKVRTSSIFIRDCSVLPIISLVLFAGSDLKVELHDGEFLFLLENGWIILKAQSLLTAELVLCLRKELFKLLEEKIRDPLLNLLNHKNGSKIIANIINLISANN